MNLRGFGRIITKTLIFFGFCARQRVNNPAATITIMPIKVGVCKISPNQKYPQTGAEYQLEIGERLQKPSLRHFIYDGYNAIFAKRKAVFS